jgi:hypothetical protein
MDAQTKVCFKCGLNLSLEEFYRHPQMGDGRLNKCKGCTKKDVAGNYQGNRKYYQEYEKKRCQTEERKKKALIYQQRRRKRFPEKEKARLLVSRAVKTGKIARAPCEVCGSPDSEAHHTDYLKPLEVRWLCFKHHREAHGQKVD